MTVPVMETGHAMDRYGWSDNRDAIGGRPSSDQLAAATHGQG